MIPTFKFPLHLFLIVEKILSKTKTSSHVQEKTCNLNYAKMMILQMKWKTG